MPKTLSDMTPQEREACRGMWCDYTDPFGKDFLVIYRHDKNGLSSVQDPKATDGRTDLSVMTRCLTPRFDLPRAWGADGEPVKGKWETAADYDGLGNGFYLDSEQPTHRRFISRWEEINEAN